MCCCLGCVGVGSFLLKKDNLNYIRANISNNGGYSIINFNRKVCIPVFSVQNKKSSKFSLGLMGSLWWKCVMFYTFKSVSVYSFYIILVMMNAELKT